MNNVITQILKLTMMIVMVHAASVKSRQLLNEIHVEVEIELRNMSLKNWNDMVPKVSGNKTKCVKEFFCLALKSLQTIEALGKLKLARQIIQYNKETEIGNNCTLKRHHKYPVVRLLEDIEKCAWP